MKNKKIILTDLEKEKLLDCVGFIENDFKTRCYEVEKEMNQIEKAGGRNDRLVDLIDYYRERCRFYNELERKVCRIIENKQI